MTKADNIKKKIKQINFKSTPAMRNRILSQATQAMEQTMEARTLARNALAAGLQDRQQSSETIANVLINEALEAGNVAHALTVLRELYPGAFQGTSADELRGQEMRGLARTRLLLMENPASSEAEAILSAVEQIIEQSDFENSSNYFRRLGTVVTLLRGDEDAAVNLLLESLKYGELNMEWRLRLAESFMYSGLNSHLGFKQLLAMLEAEAVTQRENAYKLLASLE